MSLAKDWCKRFSKEHELQRIDDWWNGLRKKSDTAWTYRMVELLRNLAQKMGYQQEYEIGVDFSWYEKESTHPSVAIEHENICSTVYNDELLKLCENIAPLKILITYVQKEDEEKELINRFKEIHKERLSESTAKQIGEEFLFVIGNEDADWRYYIFHPTGKLEQIR
jgi:hypothetical protein